MKRVLVIGGVAAGTKTAAKFKRLDQQAEVILLSKGQDISYAGCGLPYYIGGVINSYNELIVNTPQKYTALTGVTVYTGWEAIAVDVENKVVTAQSQEGIKQFFYDQLVIATGASASVPSIAGTDMPGFFTLRTPTDAAQILDYIEKQNVQQAIVIGAGFIGLEVVENLLARHIQVRVVEALPQIMANVFDSDMALLVQRHLQENGIQILTGVKASAMVGEKVVQGLQTDAGVLAAQLVISAAGVRPNTDFLKNTGIAMVKGTILVDETLQTNVPDIYAVGDCAMVSNRLTGQAQWSPMGSSANMEGRVLAQILHDGQVHYPGVLGTGVIKLPLLNCGRTGLTEEAAVKAGFQACTTTMVTDDKPHYYPGSDSFIIKLIADKNTRKILGMQVIGVGAVDKITDIAVTAISMGAALDTLECLDLAYAPPFSTAISPFVQAVHILQNKINGLYHSLTPSEYKSGKAKDYEIIDVSIQPAIPGARYINLTDVTGPIAEIPLDKKILLVCMKGKRSYLLQTRLRAYGYTHTLALEGGLAVNDVKISFTGRGIPEEEIKRVKGLGFLRDKTTPDCFNARVITRNGKITAAESYAITKAAELYGNGQIAMTTRLTIEIQHVPYVNIEPLCNFLAKAGLDTGGTGSKVRPIVSCKGTTCQYGLIDPFSLSEKIHERFYKGYHDVLLPHKFKIAIGGCPNNCVKPDLNDLGIVGQRVPLLDKTQCKGCKKCIPRDTCPIHILQCDEAGKILLDTTRCNHCGRCIDTCSFHVFDGYMEGYKIYIGGRWGKQIKHGIPMEKIFATEEEVLETIEKAILLFREQGITGERFADTITRLGFENVQKQLLTNSLLQRKTENLQARVHLKGGATC